MAVLTILRGVAASGKTSWAREQNALVVSRDAIRLAFFGTNDQDYYTVPKEVLREKEQTVTMLQDSAVRGALRVGKDVIVDNTNIEWKYVKALAKIGYAEGAEVEVKLFDVDLQTALLRNGLRHAAGGRYVPDITIKDQYNRLKSNKHMQLEPVFMPEPYAGTPGLPYVWLCDLDGTLAHMNGKRGPFDWLKVNLDDPDEAVFSVVDALNNSGEEVIFLSGRDSAARELTLEWIDGYRSTFGDFQLFMRAAGDMRPDNIVKAELFDTHIRGRYNVRGVFDDRASVVRLWKRMGLKVFNVSGLDDGEF